LDLDSRIPLTEDFFDAFSKEKWNYAFYSALSSQLNHLNQSLSKHTVDKQEASKNKKVL